MSEVSDEIMAELRGLLRCSGPFDDLADLQKLWRKHFPEDVVHCDNWDCKKRGGEWAHAGACE